MAVKNMTTIFWDVSPWSLIEVIHVSAEDTASIFRAEIFNSKYVGNMFLRNVANLPVFTATYLNRLQS
jgi:hypothetical protein